MCHSTCFVFAARALERGEIKGRRVLEVGSYDVNGSVRPLVEMHEPASYTGVDIKEGPGVDEVCGAEEMLDRFGPESFDVVISTELMEHVKDWRKVISNMKNVCRPGGCILISTRSLGFDYHGHPYDFWRYEVEDMRVIFSDCEIQLLESDGAMPGVFIKAKKPRKFEEKDLSGVMLYNIITGRRAREITPRDFQSANHKRLMRRRSLKKFLHRMGRYVFSKI